MNMNEEISLEGEFSFMLVSLHVIWAAIVVKNGVFSEFSILHATFDMSFMLSDVPDFCSQSNGKPEEKMSWEVERRSRV